MQQLVSQNCQEHEQIRRILEAQIAPIEQCHQRLAEISVQIDTQGESTRTALPLVKDTFECAVELKGMFLNMSRGVIDLQMKLSDLMSLRSLDPTEELPVIMQDALGRRLSILLEWLDTLEWDVKWLSSLRSTSLRFM